MTLVSGLPIGYEFTVKWTRDRKRWCEQTVKLMKPVPVDPHYFEVYFLQDGHIEVEATREASRPPYSCQQTLTLSFFFDGTGNNLIADVGTFKHSNVARLYRAHLRDSDAKGVYSFYLAGIGTLFKDREVNDPGGTLFGRAFGDQGQARLDFAFARLREKVRAAEARATNPTNKICWIKIAAFGFSRGAALARAFCRDLERRCVEDAQSVTGWKLKDGGHPIEITFLGLFDTVASAGLPPSANNLERNRVVNALQWANPTAKLAKTLLETPELKRLASDGPGTWADGMQIGRMVRRCVRMMSAHENRNSFPLDSSLVEVAPDHFAFQEIEKLDYGLDPEGTKHYAHTLDLFTHYTAAARSVQVPGATHGLGGQINQHMQLYYAWRFRAIHEASRSAKSGIRADQQQHIDKAEKTFVSDRAALAKEKRTSASNLMSAQDSEERLRETIEIARDAHLRYGTPIDAGLSQRYEEARRATEERQVAYDRVRARMDTAANDSALEGAITEYDRMLLQDAKQIVAWQTADRSLRLRPHYAALIEAYRDEFERGRGLTDPKIIELFDDYVHDSLAGFDTDQTWPSDPRIVYVGGDRKLRYAGIDRSDTDRDRREFA